MESLFEPIIDGILQDGYGVVDGFLSESEVEALAQRLRKRRAQGQFKEAGIGNQLVVPVQPFLSRLVVVGRHQQTGVSPPRRIRRMNA